MICTVNECVWVCMCVCVDVSLRCMCVKANVSMWRVGASGKSYGKFFCHVIHWKSTYWHFSHVILSIHLHLFHSLYLSLSLLHSSLVPMLNKNEEKKNTNSCLGSPSGICMNEWWHSPNADGFSQDRILTIREMWITLETSSLASRPRSESFTE